MDPQEAQDARVSRQGRYSAWLKKAKSENARCKLLQSHNTRYFTIDFDSQIIFYSHSTSQKKVSQPIPFRDILGAERLPLPTKSRKGRNAMIFGFILKTKQRTFELFTNSNADAAQWTFSLNAAMEMGKQKMEQLKVLQAQAEVPVRNQDDTPQKAALPTGTRTAAASEEEKETPRRPRQVEAPPAAVLEQEEEALVPPHLLKAEEQAAEKKKEEELAAKKKEEAEAAAKKQEEEAAARKKQVEEQEALRKKEEEAAARKKQEEEATARKKQEEEAAARKKQEEEAARKKQDGKGKGKEDRKDYLRAAIKGLAACKGKEDGKGKGKATGKGEKGKGREDGKGAGKAAGKGEKGKGKGSGKAKGKEDRNDDLTVVIKGIQ